VERQAFIKSDPLTNKVLSLLSGDVNKYYSADEMAESIPGASSKQVSMVFDLLMREGMLRTSIKEGKMAYKLK
jgi:hypothetical protein